MRAQVIVQGMPNGWCDQHGDLLRCHEVARFVGVRLGLAVCDGIYEIAMQHSWCVLPSRHILDVYAVGRLPPVQLVARTSVLPLRFTEKAISVVVKEDVVGWLLAEAP
jgi:hypothetical protein